MKKEIQPNSFNWLSRQEKGHDKVKELGLSCLKPIAKHAKTYSEEHRTLKFMINESKPSCDLDGGFSDALCILLITCGP